MCRERITSCHPSWSLRKLAEAERNRRGEPPLQGEDQRELDRQLPRNSSPGIINGIREDWRSLRLVLQGSGPSRLLYWQAWLAIIFAVIYILSPIDLIPDYFFSGLALLDDILILIWVIFFLRYLLHQIQRS